MQITLPLVVPLKADFTNPKRFVFKRDTIGSYNVDLGQLQSQLFDTFRDVQAKGWTIQAVTPIQGGVFDHETKTGSNMHNSMWGWGFGWGTGATEGLLLVLTRALDDQLAARFLETIPALDAYRQARARAADAQRPQIQALKERYHELKTTDPKGLRRGMMGLGRAEAFSFLDQEYASREDAEAAKAGQLAALDQEIRRLGSGDGVQITQFLRSDQLGLLQAVMPDGNTQSQCLTTLASWTLPQMQTA